MKYDVCTDAVFEKENILDALESIHELGFKAYEFWIWWEQDLDVLKKKQDELGMECAAVCAKFTYSTGYPKNQEKYLEDFRESVKACEKLECRKLIVQAGWEVPEVSHEEHRKIFMDTVKKAAPIAAEKNIEIVIEPLNIKVDHAGYNLWDTEDAFEVVKKINEPNVKILFDIYHQQITNGFIIESIRKNIENIGHIHVAGCPGRHEITTGELNYKAIFEALKEMDYKEYVGLEYFTDKDKKEGLRKAKELFVY